MYPVLQYAEKAFVRKIKDNQHLLSVAEQVWGCVRANDKKAVYHHIVSSEADVNAIHGQALLGTSINSGRSNAFGRAGKLLPRI